MKTTLQYCANCVIPVKYNPRYPHYICRDCVDLLEDGKGRKVVFYNTDIVGHGCRGYYRDSDSKEVFDGKIAFINDIKFSAREAYFGGIVVERVDKP